MKNRWPPLLFLVLALLAGFWSSGLRSGLGTLPARIEQGYEAARAEVAFQGFRFDEVEAALDKRLPRSVAVSLAPAVRSDEFFRQRFAETLYPRPVADQASFVLGPTGTELLAVPLAGVAVRLDPAAPGVRDEDLPPPSVVEPRVALALAGTLLLLLSAAGIGWLALSALEPRERGPAECVLAGAMVIGMASMLASISRVPLPSLLFPLIGGIGLLLALRRQRRALFWPEPETWGLFTLLAAAFALVLFEPAAQWDARSIWLFRAKQLHFHGHLAEVDFTNGAYSFSHFGYPLLLPAWQAFFSSFLRESFSERNAALGLFGLFAVVVGLLWRETRLRFGRAAGALLAGGLTCGVTGLVTSGMADGLLCLLLVCGYLLLMRDPCSPIGWIAIAAAALTKWEGLLFAGGIPIAVLIADREVGRLKHAGYLLSTFLALSPSVLWIGWAKLMAVTDEIPLLPANTLLQELLPRLRTILVTMLTTTARIPFLLAGAGALVFSVGAMIFAAGRRERNFFTYPGLLVACFILTCTVGIVLITPFDLEWTIATLLHRLSVHAAAFGLVAFCEAGFSRTLGKPRPT